MREVLISAAELAKALESGAPPVLLDVRWVAGVVDREGYLAGHVPGAVFVDLDADLAGPPGVGGRHPLPRPADLQKVWRAAGIVDDSSVVVYDPKDSSVAARAWWLLRWSGLSSVRVLDGGLAAWVAGGHPVETGPGASPRPGSITVIAGSMPTIDADRAREMTLSGGTLLDARAAARYRGEIEPLDPIAGHIPGAVNLPLTELLKPDGTFREPAGIEAVFERTIGPDDDGEVAASCGSGVTGCHLILAGAMIGRPLALYPGSYSEWLALGRPVAVGGPPSP
ncbi:thiosulfate/3-mercaptopyruvate sulfurtransferase [Nakamurella panacisegetis]|uniref:Thiosulfate/3-mercaptopyruvate sulfurtransferase n=1 Tax=Nakamurella panacisegetis TaxID=1090615 RepID=A0A1H0QE81_9ACTN|nr:thiosulfate/3-mercaptopyruvate sulfurtransferase [Nakamurella panacisegetis]